MCKYYLGLPFRYLPQPSVIAEQNRREEKNLKKSKMEMNIQYTFTEWYN